MKWLLVGGAAALGGWWLLSRSGGTTNFNPAAGMGYYGGFPGDVPSNGYGFPMYGGYAAESGKRQKGYFKPSMLEGNNGGF